MKKLSMLVVSLTFATALSSCASRQVSNPTVTVESRHLAPAPPDVMVKRKANFRSRLLNDFTVTQKKPMK